MNTKNADLSHAERKAKNFRLCKYLSIAVLVLFLLGGLILYENDITVENLRYLIQYLDFSSSGGLNEQTVIRYDADDSNRFYVFRGDLAVTNHSGITLYDRRGTAIMTDSFGMSNPVCITSDRYLAVYDLGGNQIRIYNSFTVLYEKTFDYPILSASLNEDGYLCVVTSEKSYHSAVLVYDRDFNEIHRWLSTDKYVMDAQLDDDGVLTIAAVRALNGSLQSELIVLKLGNKDPLFSYSFRDQIPLAISPSEEECWVLTDSQLKAVKNGEEQRQVSISKETLKMKCFGENYCALVQNELSVGVSFLLRVFDRQAAEVYSEQISLHIRDLKIFDDRIYLLMPHQLCVIPINGEKQIYSLEKEYRSLAVVSKDRVLLCGENEARVEILDQTVSS